MATSDAYGGKFTRKSEIEKPDILKSLGSEIAQVLKTVDVLFFCYFFCIS